MINAHVPGGQTLHFPDGTPPEVIQAAVKRMLAAQQGGHLGAGPGLERSGDASEPGRDSSMVRSALLEGSPLDAVLAKRQQMDYAREHGDLNAPGASSEPEPPGPLSRLQAEHGGLGRASLLYPAAEEADLLGASLGQSVIRPAVGLFARAVSAMNPDPIIREDVALTARDVRGALDRGFEGTRERFLEAHPSGAGPAIALGTEFAAQAVPFAPGVVGATARLGEGAAALAGRLAPETFEAGSAGARMLTRAVGGGAFGGVLGLGNADPDAPLAEQARQIGMSAALGAAMSGLGGAREVAGMEARGAFYPSGRLRHGPPAPTPEVRVQLLQAFEAEKQQATQEAALRLTADAPSPEPIQAAVQQVEARWQPIFAKAGAAGDEHLAALADQTQEAVAPVIKAPPPREPLIYRTSRGTDPGWKGVIPDAIRRATGQPWRRYGEGGPPLIRPTGPEPRPRDVARGPVPVEIDGGTAQQQERILKLWDYASRRHPRLAATVPEILIIPKGRGASLNVMDGSMSLSADATLADVMHELTHSAQRLKGSRLFSEAHAVRQEEAYARVPEPQTTRPGVRPDLEKRTNLPFRREVQEAIGRLRDLPDDELANLQASTTNRAEEIAVERIAFERGVGHFGPPPTSEAGFLRIGRNKPSAPPPSPIEMVMPRNEPVVPPGGLLGRLQSIADKVTDQMFDREDAPARRMRRAGLVKEAEYLFNLQARARGAGGMIDPARRAGPVYEGTYVYDPTIRASRRTGDGLQAVVGGMDDQALYDLDGLLVSQRHMELVGRKEAAQLQYDWQRAQRLEEMRQARRTDKGALRAMFGDIRSARAEELQAVRKVSRAEMEARVRESVVRQETGRAQDLRGRAADVREQALDAGMESSATGGELSALNDEARRAALYARQLLRQELRYAARKPRPGDIPPLDTQAGPRSPGFVHEADQMAMALRSVAERLGVAEGSLHALLERAGELETLGRQAGRSAGRQADQAGAAWSRLGQALPDQAAARAQGNYSIGAAQRVAMGIRDAARKRVPVVERPPDIDLNIDDRGTAAARQTLGDLEARYGPGLAQLQDVAHRFRDWTIRAWMIPLKEAGRFSDREFTYQQNPDGSFTYGGDIIAKNDLYAPFQRLMEVLGDEDVYGLSPVTSGKPNPIHAISGGLSPDLPTARPVQSAVEMAQKATLWTERQRVRNTFADAVDSSLELQQEVRKLSPTGSAGLGPKTNLPIHVRGNFPAWRDGVRSDYTAPPDVLRAVETLSPKQAGFVMEAAKLAARMLRAGATITLEFPFRNLGRDVQDAAVYGPGFNPVYKVLVDPFAGLLQSIKGGKWEQEWRANGGALSGAVAVGRPQLEALVRDVASPSGIGDRIGRRYRAEIGGHFTEAVRQRPATTLLKSGLFPFMAPLESLAGTMESASKVGAYRRMRLRGVAPGEAAAISRDVSSPDFGRAGSFGQAWNQVEAFSNAELQDLYRLGRAFRRNPGTTTIKAMAFLTLPAIANWAKNKDDPDYQNLPEWERVAFYHLAKLDNGRWVRIPRPLGLINLAFSYGPQKLLEKMHGEDPDAAEEFTRALVDQTPLHFLPQMENLRGGGRMDWLPTGVQPLAEVAAGPGGYSGFRQAPIVPQGLQDQLPEDQVRDQTSGVARAVGGATGTSPLKIDHLIQGYGATWGRMIAQGTAPSARALGADPSQDSFAGRMAQGGSPQLPTQASDIPGVRGFVSTPAIGFASDPVTRFYALSTEAAQAKASLREALGSGDVNRYQSIMREHPEVVLSEPLLATRKQLTDLRKQRNDIMSNPGYTPEQRLDMILMIDQAASAIAGAQMTASADYLRGQR